MDKYYIFHQLHQQQTGFVLPNAWDLSSAQFIQASGAKALATTSWGVAASYGLQDGEKIPFSYLLSLVKTLINHLTIPLSVDIESGYSNDAQVISQHVLSLAKLGVVGINIEDSDKVTSQLRSLHQQCTIIEKIKQTLDENGFEKLFINARTDTYLIEKDPYELTLARAKAYENAGADGVFVPGLCKIEQIKMLVNALNIPINVMAMADFNCPKIAFAGGVKRFSLGNSLYDLVGETLKKHLTQLGNNEPPAIKLI